MASNEDADERQTVRTITDGHPAPAFAHDGDAGADVSSVVDLTIQPGGRAIVGTGLRLALPVGWACLVTPRSGLAAKHGITVLNSPGLIDSGYRGEIKVILLNTDYRPFHIAVGDRIAQLVFVRVERPVFDVVGSFDATDEVDSRGEDGFGSTGVNG